jgi:uncharacterized protein
VSVPTRLRFKELPADRLPRSEAVSMGDADFGKTVDAGFIDQVVDRWRSATLSTRNRAEPVADAPSVPPTPVAPTQNLSGRLDPERYRLLKRPAKANP